MRLLVVTGDLVEETITQRPLERAARGLTADRREVSGPLPTAVDMAEAIAGEATDLTLPSRHTVVGGAPLDSLPRVSFAPGP